MYAEIILQVRVKVIALPWLALILEKMACHCSNRDRLDHPPVLPLLCRSMHLLWC